MLEALPAAEFELGRAGTIAGLRSVQSFSAIPVPDPPVIRKRRERHLLRQGVAGSEPSRRHSQRQHPISKTAEVSPRLSSDEKKLFDVIARAYLVALMSDFRYRQTTATLDVRGFDSASRSPAHSALGWRAAFPEWQPADERAMSAIAAAAAQRRRAFVGRGSCHGRAAPRNKGNFDSRNLKKGLTDG